MILFIYFGRLVVDLILVMIMVETGIYEFPTTLIILVVSRITVGHATRIVQRLSNLFDDFYDLIIGVVAAIPKVGLEIWILIFVMKSKDIDMPMNILIIAGAFMILRSLFEGVSICKDLIDDFSE